MTFPWNRYRDLAAQLSADLADATQHLEIERTKRIAAETLAAERAVQLGLANQAVQRAEFARDEAVKGRMASLDLVNTKLLEGLGPEKPGPDPKQFTTIQNPARKPRAAQALLAMDAHLVSILEAKKKTQQPIQAVESAS